MKFLKSISFVVITVTLLSGCFQKEHNSSTVCLGKSHDTLIEAMGTGNMNFPCKKGDVIATKIPGHFCDFNYQISFNDFNSAFCVYAGEMRDARVEANKVSAKTKQNQQSNDNNTVKNGSEHMKE